LFHQTCCPPSYNHPRVFCHPDLQRHLYSFTSLLVQNHTVQINSCRVGEQCWLYSIVPLLSSHSSAVIIMSNLCTWLASVARVERFYSVNQQENNAQLARTKSILSIALVGENHYHTHFWFQIFIQLSSILQTAHVILSWCQACSALCLLRVPIGKSTWIAKSSPKFYPPVSSMQSILSLLNAA
jgi:hypothetical protein